MGNSGSTNIPGGGTEGYHVLRVSLFSRFFFELHFLKITCLLNELSPYLRVL